MQNCIILFIFVENAAGLCYDKVKEIKDTLTMLEAIKFQIQTALFSQGLTVWDMRMKDVYRSSWRQCPSIINTLCINQWERQKGAARFNIHLHKRTEWRRAWKNEQFYISWNPLGWFGKIGGAVWKICIFRSQYICDQAGHVGGSNGKIHVGLWWDQRAKTW